MFALVRILCGEVTHRYYDLNLQLRCICLRQDNNDSARVRVPVFGPPKGAMTQKREDPLIS